MADNIRQDNYFKIDPECHLVGDMEHLSYFTGVQMWWRAIDNIKRPLITGAPWEMLAPYAEGMEEREMTKDASPENIIWAMDKYGVDIACLLPESMMDSTGYTTRWVTNGQMAKIVETNPQRFLYQPNVSPIKYKGVQNTIKEMIYWVRERGAKIFKFYPPEDTYMNDPEIWPFYEKAQELGIVLDIHTGFCWVPPGKSKYALPVQLDDVARDFPELKINAFHMGYPHSDDLNMIAMQHPNVYICLSLLVPWSFTAPRKFGKLLGEALRWVGPDKITWGTDYAGYAAQIRGAVKGFIDFQIPEDLQAQYGYAPITDEDKAKIFGGNLARLLGIDISKRRVSG